MDKFSLENEEVDPAIFKTISQINNNRSKMLDTFVHAFLATNAPKDFDWPWVLRNIILCHRTIIQDGKIIDQHWIEIRERPR